jgi:7-cyano-7-deazaguanine synthase in queuosine biosynthesis
MDEKSTIISFSGGVDSTYCIWRFMKENPEKKIILHHLILKYSNENNKRWKKEKEAVFNILHWFRINGYNKQFQYMESSFEYGKIKNAIYDIETTAIFLGIIMRANKNIDEILISTNKDDAHGETDLEKIKQIKKRQSRDTIYELFSQRNDFNINYYAYQKTKQQMIEEMPKSLIALCWYCRSPKNSTMKPCGECHACNQFNNKK